MRLGRGGGFGEDAVLGKVGQAFALGLDGLHPTDAANRVYRG